MKSFGLIFEREGNSNTAIDIESVLKKYQSRLKEDKLWVRIINYNIKTYNFRA